MPQEKLQPNHDKISHAFAVLSEELPRLSNLDTNIVIKVLENLQTDLADNLRAQQRLTIMLDERLLKLQQSLDSLDKRLGGFEKSLVQLPVSDGEEVLGESQQDSNKNIPVHIPPSPVHHLKSNRTHIFEGPSGALIVIIVSMIPIVIALYWPNVFE